ncbi:MAG: 3-hydroxyacyl-ACP dehydratase FabZ [Holosporales bacterium]|jgi:3-hydroxyacyl-[acyl-carrier-protein] dehydratase|nr:3-hydroxyacyl-ACP dehydratase FabZ [Holosporales bacterium]
MVIEANYLKIKELLPHRYPFLFIDKVENIVLGESAKGIKNVTINEQIFQGHFPDDPIFPGVLIVEAMAQTAAVLALLSTKDAEPEKQESKDSPQKQKSIYFMTIDSVKFRKPVRPGDSLELNIVKEQMRGNIWRFKGEAFVRSELVSEASFMAMLNNG